MNILRLFDVDLDMTIYGNEGPINVRRGDVLVVFEKKTIWMQRIRQPEAVIPGRVRLP